MKVVSSLKDTKKGEQIVRRKKKKKGGGTTIRLYRINKRNPRRKARQG